MLLSYDYTMYSPKILGNFERKCVEDSLFLGVTICCLLIPSNSKHIHVLFTILDPNVPYFAGKLPDSLDSRMI